MQRLLKIQGWIVLGMAMSLVCGAVQAQQATIKGAGATFPLPLYKVWFEKFKAAKQTDVAYDAVGSGEGIQALISGSIDFAASDMPIPPRTAEPVGKDEIPVPPDGPDLFPQVVQIPTCGGAIAIVYHLDGLSSLQLTPEILADIYLGKIRLWSDPAIKAANPGITLPNTQIKPLHRTDPSGSTYIFTNYLVKATSGRGGVKPSMSGNWMEGLGNKGSDGLAQSIKNTNASIGYVEVGTAKKNTLTIAAIRNRAGKFVLPEPTNMAAALDAYAASGKSGTAALVDPTGAESYPIVSLTYIILYKQSKNKAAHDNVVTFLEWVQQAEQQAQCQALQYNPLPATLIKQNLQTLSRMHGK